VAFDNRYPHRKDWRRPHRGSKSADRTCRNHGSCPWCRLGRLHAGERRKPPREG
jgi:hypothetical protein